jgi:hypothetical protein
LNFAGTSKSSHCVQITWLINSLVHLHQLEL